MFKKLAALAAICFGLLCFSYSVAAATTEQPAPTGDCFDVSYVPEYLYERFIPHSHEEPVFKTQHEVDKFTRTRTLSLKTGWSAYSTPTRWVPIGSHDAFVDVVAAPNWQAHASGFDHGVYFERQWALLATGVTRQVQTGTVVVEDPSTRETLGWTDEGPEIEGWTLIEKRYREVRTYKDCPPPTTVPPTTVPPTTVPPTTVPPVTTPPVTTPPVVEPPVVIEPPVTLAYTGRNTVLFTGIGFLLVFAGVSSLVLSRRKAAA